MERDLLGGSIEQPVNSEFHRLDCSCREVLKVSMDVAHVLQHVVVYLAWFVEALLDR